MLNVRVVPRARKSEVAGTRGDALLVRIAAPPHGGAANDALVDLLAARLDRPRRSIRIVSGGSGRGKRVAISGVTADVVCELLLGTR